jgi:hypothetical protein
MALAKVRLAYAKLNKKAKERGKVLPKLFRSRFQVSDAEDLFADLEDAPAEAASE